MSALVSVLLVLIVAAVIALPLVRAEDRERFEAARADERWEREKAIALVAIREAEFDHATGKLDENDYRTLRDNYEERALAAMKELDRDGDPTAVAGAGPAAGDAAAQANFCSRCGRAFAAGDSFCGGCGHPRSGGAVASAEAVG